MEAASDTTSSDHPGLREVCIVWVSGKLGQYMA